MDLPRPGILGWVGLAIVGTALVIAVLGPILAPYPVGEIVVRIPFAPAGGRLSMLGGDGLGRVP